MPRPASRSSLLVLAALFVSLTSACATGPKVETQVYERPDGVIVVETVELRATVTKVDAAKREITLKAKYEKPRVLKAGEAVANFNQIRVGDVVEVVVADELAVSLIAGGAPPSAGEASVVALAPLGEKPGVVMADTVELTGTVIAIDGHEHTVTLEFEDGETREIKVSKSRDLSQVGLGDSVRIQLTKAVAITVRTPGS